MNITAFSVLLIAAWFVQMGAHEGAHAYAAAACGDDTAEALGKKSFNPLAHIDWKNRQSVLFSVVAPVVTALMGLVPMGMAWVPVTRRTLRNGRRDMALVSVAGPVANLCVSALCLPAHMALAMLGDVNVGLLNIFDQLLFAVYVTSLLYGVFNLIPIPPLDGSQVLSYFLRPWGREVLARLRPYGMWMLVALFVMGPGGGVVEVPLSIGVALWQLMGG